MLLILPQYQHHSDVPQVHDVSRRFKCDECTYRFNSSAVLVKHRTILHSDQQQRADVGSITPPRMLDAQKRRGASSSPSTSPHAATATATPSPNRTGADAKSIPLPRTPPIVATSENVAQMVLDVFSAVDQLNCMSAKAVDKFRKLSQAGKLVCPGNQPNDPRPTNPDLSAHVLVQNVKSGYAAPSPSAYGSVHRTTRRPLFWNVMNSWVLWPL